MPLKLEDMTWKEIQESMEQGMDTVLILLGSIEQHGPHLPIKTDTVISEKLGVRTAEKLGDALVAPVIRPGCSRHHMDFPGTISYPEDLLKDIIKQYCIAYDKHGFEHIVLIPFHGGNFSPVENAVTEVESLLKNSNLISITDLQGMMDLMNEGMKKGGVDFEEPVIHAGAGETSIMLAIDEDFVREERIEKGHVGDLPVAKLFNKGLKHFTDNGVLGDPNMATKKAGEEIIESISQTYADEIRRLRDQ